MEKAVQKASEDVCLYFYLFGDPEFGEECDNALVDCAQIAANGDCNLGAKDEGFSLHRFQDCLKEWRAEYNAEGNPFKAFLKWVLKRAKDKKKK
jgi:hypothetical protein